MLLGTGAGHANVTQWEDIDSSIAEIRDLGCLWELLGQAEPPGSKPLTGVSCHVPSTLSGKQARPRCDTPDLLLTSALERDRSAPAGLP